MYNEHMNGGYDIPPGAERLGGDDMIAVEVISSFREGENGEMEVEYERAYVHRPPGGVFHEPLDQTPTGNRETIFTMAQTRETDLRKLYHEKERFATFLKRWSDEYHAHPADLARNGLYYIGPGDKVKCIFCRRTLRGWEYGDVVEEEHKRNYPDCPFVQGRCNGMNVPLNTPETMRQSYSVIVKRTEVPQTPPAEPLSDSMEILNNRLLTFKHSWPKSAPVDPMRLAEAGFFYTGDGDKTRCFKCRKLIHHWEAGDDPMKEHERLYPECSFVQSMNEQQFMHNAARPLTPPSDPQASQNFVGATKQEQFRHPAQVSDLTNEMAKLKIDEDMKSSAVKAFQEIYSEVSLEDIRLHVESIRITKGPDYKIESQDIYDSFLNK